MAKKTKKDFWMFTVVNEYNSFKNLWFDEFPTQTMLNEACNRHFVGKYTIVNIIKLTEEQYNKLEE